MPYYDTATRAQALSLKLFGASNDEIQRITGITPSTLNRIYDRAIERGFNPSESSQILDKHVEDAPKSGRPAKQSQHQADVIEKVRRDRYGREKTCEMIALEIGSISAMTVWRILRNAGFKKTKPTRKPGLTKAMKQARLEFCLKFQHWTLEDWKKVIWSDETSVVLNHRRGGYKVWRRSDEAWVKSCIRPRWKGYSEFMFWGCFSYLRKGPFHIWKPETVAEQKAAEKEIAKLNEELEPTMKARWEIENGMRRLALENLRGRKPKWRWTKENGKLTRRKGTGVDWWRYQNQVLIPKLIPFAKECQLDYPDTIVQEDNAPSHAHHAQGAVFSLANVLRLLWPGNSPDLNMIEPAWIHLKREVTKKGAPQSRAQAERDWKEAWENLSQEKIQSLISRIVIHIQKVIELEGGNEYMEGTGESREKRRRRGQNTDEDWEEVEA